jgi:endonuclease/exonuclease/phosphatase (EEP) superfamily protein YafD
MKRVPRMTEEARAESRTPPGTSARARLRLLCLPLAIGTAATATAAAAFASHGWPFELFAHFRWQLAAAGLVLLSLAYRRRRWPPTFVAALVFVLNAVELRTPQALSPSVACDGPTLRVVTVNVWFLNEDPARLLAWLEESPADVVVVQEVNSRWAQAFAQATREYPYRRIVARDDPYGLALLSRWPFERIDTFDFAHDGVPSLRADLRVEGRDVHVIGVHTHWPLLPGLHRARDASLADAARMAAAWPDSTVLLGDLNVSPYAPSFRRLLETSRLRDAFADQAWHPTWQVPVWPLSLPIDHVLVPRTACVTAARVGRSIGSDHRPVFVELRLP